MRLNIKNNLFAAIILASLGLGSCCNEDSSHLPNNNLSFVATLMPSATVDTRAGEQALPVSAGDVTVMSPGYANESATWQQAIYKVSTGGILTAKEPDKAIKRTASDMPFAAWTTPAGVNSADKTVDFTSDELENFVGAWTQADNIDRNVVALPFEHLVSKITLNVVKDGSIITDFDFTLPSIKRVGQFITTLSAYPKVTNGASGEILSKKMSATTNVIYLPPIDNFAESGVFTLTINKVDYIGTLNNLKDAGTANSIIALKAGQNLIITINILDDHSVQFLGITIAPWNESSNGELFNRPGPGIWSSDDLIDFAQEYNKGNAGTDNFKKRYVVTENGKPYVRLYTDIEVGSGFEAIGTTAVPFTGITFDGNGYTISGITLKADTQDNIGLFGYSEHVALRNIRLDACVIKGQNNVGVLVGRAGSGTIIDNCRIAGKSSASGKNQIGGLAGMMEAGSRLANCCIVESSLSGKEKVGGIAGICNGSIINAYAILSNGLDGIYAGGLVGTLKSGAILRNCYASSNFTNGTGQTTNGALISSADKGAIATSLYWDANCISNEKCPSAIGGRQLQDDLSDVITGYSAFSSVSGRLINSANNKDDNQDYLFTRLNDYISNLEAEFSYKGWAIVGRSFMPVLRP